MPNPDVLYESQAESLTMKADEATALSQLGTRLAGQAAWWGAPDSDDGRKLATAIRVRAVSPGTWNVRVNDAVGVIRVAGRSVPVLPKIPLPHFLHLLEVAGTIPRLDEHQRTEVRDGADLFDLLATWFVRQVEAVMRGDLIRDYRPERTELTHVRGRIDTYRTALNLTRGRVAIDCEYEELDVDNALNRVLLAALRHVTRSPLARALTRTHALRLTSRFDGVTGERAHDRRVTITPRTWYYADALSLAKLLLNGSSGDRHPAAPV
jgi:5-methylcytosine-specific restriction endonuclease McrBC regulatory subunit McrC